MLKEVVQVYPQNDFTVYVYFSDGVIKLYDVKPVIKKGGVFKQIANIDAFMNLCTVLNNTLAWDVGGNYDPVKCLDLDPEVIYQQGRSVDDPLEKIVQTQT